MKRTNKTIIGTAAAVLFLAALIPAAARSAEVNFAGNVVRMDNSNVPLAQKFEQAFTSARKERRNTTYFTGYIFTGLHRLRFNGEGQSGDPYRLVPEQGQIKIRRTEDNRGYSSSNTGEEKKNYPTGVVFLHSGSTGEILDATQIDLEEMFDVGEVPLYWFGEADQNESFRFLTGEFENAASSLQSDLIFLIGAHVHSGTQDFLYQVALDSFPVKTREQAIFWLGSNTYANSLDLLKKIYAQEKNGNLREKVVFSLYLLEGDEAVRELIRIAKNDTDSSVRQQSIFWLGQKATAESVKALEDVVSDTKEETKVKEAAVFAISQLPAEKSVPMLIDIAKSNTNPKVRENAIFWIGQKDGKAALEFFEEILLKKK